MEKTVSIYVVSINMAGLGNTYDKALEDDCCVNASPMNETKTQKTSPPAVACTSMSSNHYHILLLLSYT
jgi:hypothetical protein